MVLKRKENKRNEKPSLSSEPISSSHVTIKCYFKKSSCKIPLKLNFNTQITSIIVFRVLISGDLCVVIVDIWDNICAYPYKIKRNLHVS